MIVHDKAIMSAHLDGVFVSWIDTYGDEFKIVTIRMMRFRRWFFFLRRLAMRQPCGLSLFLVTLKNP